VNLNHSIPRFNDLAALADLITASPQSLATGIRTAIGDSIPVVTLPDGALPQHRLESSYRWLEALRAESDPREFAFRSASSQTMTQSIGRFLERVRYARGDAHAANGGTWPGSQDHRGVSAVPRKTVVWFNHLGWQHSSVGLASLVSVLGHLAYTNRCVPLQLVVIANNPRKYRPHFRNPPFPTRLVRSSDFVISRELQAADLAVLPNLATDFRVAPPATRVVTALCHGVPVVAARNEVPEELKPAVAIENWRANILSYLNEPARAAEDVQEARQLIAEHFDLSSIGATWKACLAGLSAPLPAPEAALC
jgi:hypothetical protein